MRWNVLARPDDLDIKVDPFGAMRPSIKGRVRS
jgi:hypothetical protein